MVYLYLNTEENCELILLASPQIILFFLTWWVASRDVSMWMCCTGWSNFVQRWSCQPSPLLWEKLDFACSCGGSHTLTFPCSCNKAPQHLSSIRSLLLCQSIAEHRGNAAGAPLCAGQSWPSTAWAPFSSSSPFLSFLLAECAGKPFSLALHKEAPSITLEIPSGYCKCSICKKSDLCGDFSSPRALVDVSGWSLSKMQLSLNM